MERCAIRYCNKKLDYGYYELTALKLCYCQFHGKLLEKVLKNTNKPGNKSNLMKLESECKDMSRRY
jgi:hypothetical protein